MGGKRTISSPGSHYLIIFRVGYSELSFALLCPLPNFSFNWAMSLLIFFSTTLAYFWVVESLVCPRSLETVSMGTSFIKVIVVAKVCLATWKVRCLSIFALCAMIFRYWFTKRYMMFQSPTFLFNFAIRNFY